MDRLEITSTGGQLSESDIDFVGWELAQYDVGVGNDDGYKVRRSLTWVAVRSKGKCLNRVQQST
jgi:hypothetical protein